MKARINNGLVVETFADEYAGNFHEDTVIVDVPSYLETYVSSDGIGYDVDRANFTFDKVKFSETLKARIATERWIKETNGITVEGVDFRIPTTIESQNRILNLSASYDNGDISLDEKISFIVGTKVALLDHNKLTEIRTTIAQYIQNTFTRQRELYELVDTLVNAKKTTIEKIINAVREGVDQWGTSSVAVQEALTEE